MSAKGTTCGKCGRAVFEEDVDAGLCVLCRGEPAPEPEPREPPWKRARRAARSRSEGSGPLESAPAPAASDGPEEGES
jgi:hypothetical protein